MRAWERRGELVIDGFYSGHSNSHSEQLNDSTNNRMSSQQASEGEYICCLLCLSFVVFVVCCLLCLSFAVWCVCYLYVAVCFCLYFNAARCCKNDADVGVCVVTMLLLANKLYMLCV